MRELLLAFVIALIVGSIINGVQSEQKTNSQNASNNGRDTNSAQPNSINGQRDFPDFASFANINNDNFDKLVLKSPKPVFIDCYVPNSQACDQMQPLVAALGKNHENILSMAKLNVMDNIVLAHRYDIANVPTFLLFDRGKLVSKVAGILPQDRLESMIATLQRNEQ